MTTIIISNPYCCILHFMRDQGKDMLSAFNCHVDEQKLCLSLDRHLKELLTHQYSRRTDVQIVVIIRAETISRLIDSRDANFKQFL